MAFSLQISATPFAGNGSTVTQYPVGFPINGPEDIAVAVENPAGATPVGLVPGQFTVHLSGGAYSVSTATAYPPTALVTVYRELPFDQPFSFSEGGILRTTELERALDRIVMQIQRLWRLTTAGSGGTVYPTGGAIVAALAVWPDAEARQRKIPAYVGQLGVQYEDSTVWIAQSTAAGDWLNYPSAALANQVTALEAVVAALRVAVDSGHLGYLTKAAMDADLAHVAGTLAEVVSDSTEANNGTYIKSGASGSGSWGASTVNTVKRLKTLETDLLAKGYYVTGESDYVGTAPVTGLSLSSAFAYVQDAPVAFAGFVTTFEFWATTTGNLEIITFSRSGNNLTVKNRQTTAVSSTGLNVRTFTTEFPVNAGDLVGIYGAGGVLVAYATGGSVNYWDLNANPSGTQDWGAVGTASLKYRYRTSPAILMQPYGVVNAATETRIAGVEGKTAGIAVAPAALALTTGRKLLYSEVFTSSTPANWSATGAWTSASGYLSPVAASWADNVNAKLAKTFSINQRRTTVEFKCQSNSPVVAIAWYENATAIATGRGTMIGLDGVNGLLKIYGAGSFFNVSAEPTVVASVALGFSLLTNDEVRIQVERRKRVNIVQVTKVSTGQTAVVKEDGGGLSTYNYVSGDQVDNLGIRVAIGRILVTAVRVSGGKPGITVQFSGDSLQNGYGLANADRHTAIIETRLGSDKVAVSGRDGAVGGSSAGIISAETVPLSPAWLVWCYGTNDQDAGLTAHQAAFATAKAACDAAGIKMAVMILPPASGRTLTATNAWLLGLAGVRFWRVDKALTVGNDGVTQDTSLYQADLIHWNAAGSLKAAARLETDIPEIFE